MKTEDFNLLGKVVKEVLKQKPDRIQLRGKETPLKRYRVELGISGREAAKRLHISYRNWHRIENKDLNKVPLSVLLLIQQGCLLEYNGKDKLYEWWKQYQ